MLAFCVYVFFVNNKTVKTGRNVFKAPINIHPLFNSVKFHPLIFDNNTFMLLILQISKCTLVTGAKSIEESIALPNKSHAKRQSHKSVRSGMTRNGIATYHTNTHCVQALTGPQSAHISILLLSLALEHILFTWTTVQWDTSLTGKEVQPLHSNEVKFTALKVYFPSEILSAFLVAGFLQGHLLI